MRVNEHVHRDTRIVPRHTPRTMPLGADAPVSDIVREALAVHGVAADDPGAHGFEAHDPGRRRIRVATMGDFAAMQRNYARARKVMAANGNPTQWGSTFPRERVVREDIAQGRARVLVDRGGPEGGERILAQFAVCPGVDPTYVHIDGAWLDDGPYVAMHRVASSGLERRVARECLLWAVATYGNVRIDTHPNNAGMRHVIEGCGFTRCGCITLLDRERDLTRIAYQRRASSATD